MQKHRGKKTQKILPLKNYGRGKGKAVKKILQGRQGESIGINTDCHIHNYQKIIDKGKAPAGIMIAKGNHRIKLLKTRMRNENCILYLVSSIKHKELKSQMANGKTTWQMLKLFKT